MSNPKPSYDLVLISGANMQDNMLVKLPNSNWYYIDAVSSPPRGLLGRLRSRVFGYQVRFRGVARGTGTMVSGQVNSRDILLTQKF